MNIYLNFYPVNINTGTIDHLLRLDLLSLFNVKCFYRQLGRYKEVARCRHSAGYSPSPVERCED